MSNPIASDGAAVPSSLPVLLDDASKAVLARAAELRGISFGEYVWTVTVAQAQREVLAAEAKGEAGVRLEDLTASPTSIKMSPEGMAAFLHALENPRPLTPAQKELGRLMRESL